MSSKEVRTERIRSTLLITLDRPQARNAVNAAVAAGLAAALDELEADPSLVLSADPEHLWSQLSQQARGTMALAEVRTPD